jgi:CDP-diacylglycerol--serine O-phosphatidyltransferase
MALKFKSYGLKDNALQYGLIGIAILSIILLKWLAVPGIFILYLLASAFYKEQTGAPANTNSETKDIFV